MTQTEKNAIDIAELRRALADQKDIIGKIIGAIRSTAGALPSMPKEQL
jgi:hypothetical protein